MPYMDAPETKGVARNISSRPRLHMIRRASLLMLAPLSWSGRSVGSSCTMHCTWIIKVQQQQLKTKVQKLNFRSATFKLRIQLIGSKPQHHNVYLWTGTGFALHLVASRQYGGAMLMCAEVCHTA